jgi:hypothetical protein
LTKARFQPLIWTRTKALCKSPFPLESGVIAH